MDALYLLGWFVLALCLLGSLMKAWDKQPDVWIVRCTRSNGKIFYEVKYKLGLFCVGIWTSYSKTEEHAKMCANTCAEYLKTAQERKVVSKEKIDV